MTRTRHALAIIIVVAAAWILGLPPASVEQPIAFNHAKHAAVGCSVCHRGAETAARAAIPQANVCLKCHTTAPPPVKAALWDEIAGGGQIGWVRVTRIPDHSFFSHRRHVTLGEIACGSCHADVGTRATPAGVAPLRLDMDACLSCHQDEGASEDCAACHR